MEKNGLKDVFLFRGTCVNPLVPPYDGLRRQCSETWGGYDENDRIQYWTENFEQEFRRGRWVRIG